MLSLILPAYDEARLLPASLARCAEFCATRGLAAEIIVADDGSEDGTADAVARTVATLPADGPPIRHLVLPHRGKGGAVRAGMLAASGDPRIFLDADLTIPVDILDDFLAAIGAGADIAIASRYVTGSVVHRPRWRRVMGDAYRVLVRLLVPTGVQDTQCGGKAYSARTAQQLFARQRIPGFAFDAEILFLARRAGFRVAEIPFELRQQHGTTIDFLRDAPRMVRDLLLIRLNDLAGRYR